MKPESWGPPAWWSEPSPIPGQVRSAGGGRSGTDRHGWWLTLLVAPGRLAASVGSELLAEPAAKWPMLLVGKNAANCMRYIPLMGIGPMAVLLLALRYGAPTRPGLAGVVAGLTAGAVAATTFAAHCTDHSPLFVATWYPLAIGLLALAGGVAGRYVARW